MKEPGITIPTIKDLYSEKDLAIKNDALTVLLNQNPDQKWVKKNKYANNSLYLPIERVEWLLRKVFKNYKIEVIETKQVFNGISCTVRLHYKNPISEEWQFHDGVGAAQIQTKAGKSPADLANINNNAVQLCVPIAKSEALKNAAKSFGKLFGSDLNRKDKISYSLDVTLQEMTPEHPNWKKCVEAIRDGVDISQITGKYDISKTNLKQMQDESI